MSLYWRKHHTNQNTDLPQKIMRPFWHPEAEKLNDEIFSMILSHERPKFIQFIVLLLTIPLLYFSITGFLQASASINNINALSDQDIYLLLSNLTMLITAFLLYFLFSKIIKQRHLCFDRKQHNVLSAKKSILPKYLNHDYDDMLGAIECYKNLFGKRKSWLVLKHKTEKYKIRLYYTYDSPQELIGYWSFIVQYMKKNAPLPEVPALHQYPDKLEGVVTGSTYI
jgi:hypothetical protein